MVNRHELGIAKRRVGIALAAGALGIAGVAAAGPATAAPIGEEAGTYEITYDNTPQGRWEISPCGSGCATIASDAGWTTKASVVNGQWTFSRVKDQAVDCQDGSTGAGSIVYEWPVRDDDTIAGLVTITSAEGACGDSAPNTLPPKPFTLTKVS